MVVLKSVLYGSYDLYVLFVYLFIIGSMNFVYPCSIKFYVTCYWAAIFHQLPFWDMVGINVAICCHGTGIAAQVLIPFMNFLVVPRFFLSAVIVGMVFMVHYVLNEILLCVMLTVVICHSIS